jgi:hypothetical protein
MENAAENMVQVDDTPEITEMEYPSDSAAGEGYRYLRLGETIQAGDEVETANGWQTVSQNFLDIYTEVGAIPVIQVEDLETPDTSDCTFFRRKVA